MKHSSLRSGKSTGITRRGFLAAIGVGTVVLVVGAGGHPRAQQSVYHFLRSARKELIKPGHVQGTLDTAPVDTDMLNTVIAFIGALIGRKLLPEDTDELRERLVYAATQDSGWRSQYTWLARYADDQAKATGAARFLKAEPGQRMLILDRIMGISPTSKRSFALGFVSGEERQRRRMHFSTIPHLLRVYRHSGVPYRHRGYSSWPGIPGDPFEYTRRGPAFQC